MTITLAQPAPPKAPRSCCLNHKRYTAGCPGCQAAAAAYFTHRKRQKAYGRWSGRADATAAAQHIRRLVNAGMTVQQISEATGWLLLEGDDALRVPVATRHGLVLLDNDGGWTSRHPQVTP